MTTVTNAPSGIGADFGNDNGSLDSWPRDADVSKTDADDSPRRAVARSDSTTEMRARREARTRKRRRPTFDDRCDGYAPVEKGTNIEPGWPGTTPSYEVKTHFGHDGDGETAAAFPAQSRVRILTWNPSTSIVVFANSILTS